MSDDLLLKEVRDYIDQSRFASLLYVREDRAPVARAMGSFAPDGLDLLFSSRQGSDKVKAIASNKKVSFFFEHDNQTLETWRSVLLLGEAERVERQPELARAVELLGNRSPRFKERIANGELSQTAIFKLTTREIEYLDWTRGVHPTQKIRL